MSDAIHPSLRLTPSLRRQFAAAVEFMDSLEEVEYSELYHIFSSRLPGLGSCGSTGGEHRWAICMSDTWGQGWWLKWGNPKYGMDLHNRSELEIYDRLTSAREPDIRLAALRHLVPVYDLGLNVLASPSLEWIEDEDIMPAVSDIAMKLNIPDAHPGNVGRMLQPDGSTDLAFFDYGYCLTPDWLPSCWPQGEASAPADIHEYFARQVAGGPGSALASKIRL